MKKDGIDGSDIDSSELSVEYSDSEEDSDCKLMKGITSITDSNNAWDKDHNDIQRFDSSELEKISDFSPTGFVGFSSLPAQVYRKSLKKGFEFVLLVVGETGLGKSTLINSMFLTDIYTSKEVVRMKRTVEVGTHHVVLEEGGVKLSLTVVDTPGYGDAVDNTDC